MPPSSSSVEPKPIATENNDPEVPNEDQAPAVESLLERFFAMLATPEKRRLFCQRLLRAVRIILVVVTVLYLLPLFITAVAAHWWAEKNLTLAFLTFLPSQLWLLPLFPLLFITVFFSRKLAAFQALFGVAFVFVYMDYQPSSKPWKPEPESLTIVSYNRGQHGNQSLQPFKNQILPDLLVLQDATHRAAQYAKAEGYAEFTHTEGIGEFVLLSKYPIRNKELIGFGEPGHIKNVAARFEIEIKEQTVAIYSVHLPTPRDTLSYYRRGAFLYGIIGVPGTKWAQRRRENQQYWDDRSLLASQLAEKVTNEKLPCIAIGDFNAPDHGYIYHLFAKPLTDAHEKAGSGFGYTFPGTTRNPLTLRGPWLRLDYAFCSDALEPVSFVTEKDRPSQHRAIAAAFSFTSAPHSK